MALSGRLSAQLQQWLPEIAATSRCNTLCVVSCRRSMIQLPIVTDSNHPQLRHALQLHSKRQDRHRQGRIVLTSNRLINDYRRCGYKLHSYLYPPSTDLNQLPPSLSRAVKTAPRVCVSDERLLDFTNRLSVPDAVGVMERISQNDTPQATSKLDQLPQLQDVQRVPIIVVCDALRNPGNVGSIIRTAAGFDLQGVVTIGDSCDAWSTHSLSSSAGAHAHIPVAHCDTLDSLTTELQRQQQSVSRLDVVLMDSGKTSHDVDDLFERKWQFDHPTLLVLGSEQAGLTDASLNASCFSHPDVHFRHAVLPMRESSDSLNVGHACAMAVALAVAALP
eukprot:TRINITY_DN10421_c0_g2_i1.p1 TRINITY_DN10421_c0_g2~~TRINITY_DN10421_c0_g2_i1.p1  ORF type:complete len:334 (+),score=40.73 TRINITY_DN10421_c0_g2_i1:110-1111(+)